MQAETDCSLLSLNTAKFLSIARSHPMEMRPYSFLRWADQILQEKNTNMYTWHDFIRYVLFVKCFLIGLWEVSLCKSYASQSKGKHLVEAWGKVLESSGDIERPTNTWTYSPQNILAHLAVCVPTTVLMFGELFWAYDNLLRRYTLNSLYVLVRVTGPATLHYKFALSNDKTRRGSDWGRNDERGPVAAEMKSMFNPIEWIFWKLTDHALNMLDLDAGLYTSENQVWIHANPAPEFEVEDAQFLCLVPKIKEKRSL